MTSVSKHLQPLKEVNIGHGEDRISSLPDSLLIYILSFIPTKFAFRTTVLSKRWKDLWAFVPNLDFDGAMLDAPMQTPDYDKSFMNFVTKVFFFHRSSCIKRFHLKDGGGIDVSRVHTWISVLTAHGVEEVDIEMYTRQDLILPQKLFCCKTLVVLKLINELKFNFPTSVYLPNLKILHVSLHYPENDITQKLFTSCPMLEDLHLRANVVDELEMIFHVSSPTLKKLKFHLITFLECEHFDRGMKLSKNKIVVNAPVLEHLTVRDDYLPCYSLNNLSLLVRAYINVGHCCIELLGTKEHANKLFMLLEGITSVKFLSLAAATMGALEFADDYKLPLYPNLTNLELAVHNNYSWRRLPDLLDCVPKLKTLTLLKDGRFLCSSIPTYRQGKEAGSEECYIVRMSTWYPNPGSVKISDGETIVLESIYNRSQSHGGVMGLFYILVADDMSPNNPNSVVHPPVEVRFLGEKLSYC